MSKHVDDQIIALCHASGARKVENIQTLWSGYGEISRYELSGSKQSRAIVKHVKLPDKSQHPRGWNTQRSHLRKIKSYQVECAWYQNYSALSDDNFRLPTSYGTVNLEDEFIIVMEDLAEAGYNQLKQEASIEEMKRCLSWLANLHARFMQVEPDSLWTKGCYWHLDTRPDELEALEDKALKASALSIDQALTECPFQTIVHGDAKLANFCFHQHLNSVAAVDFQYVGGGCGMKDVAYFIGSCLHEEDCERYESLLLDYYFDCLQAALTNYHPRLDPSKVETSWRPLFDTAWADFHRFLKGWSPGHWKIHSYSERLTRSVINRLR